MRGFFVSALSTFPQYSKTALGSNLGVLCTASRSRRIDSPVNACPWSLARLTTCDKDPCPIRADLDLSVASNSSEIFFVAMHETLRERSSNINRPNLFSG